MLGVEASSSFVQWAAVASVGVTTGLLWAAMRGSRLRLMKSYRLGIETSRFAMTLTEANQELANITAVLADSSARAIVRLYDIGDPLAEELAVPTLDAGARFTEHFPDLAAAAEKLGEARS